MKLTTNLPWQPTLFVSSGLSQKKITHTHTHTRERQRERETSERDRHKGRQTEKQTKEEKQNIQHNTKLRNRKKVAQRGLIYRTILNKCEKYNAVRKGTDSGHSICNCNCVSDSKNMGYDTYYIYVKLQPTAMLLAGLYPELKQTMVETISPVLSWILYHQYPWWGLWLTKCPDRVPWSRI